MQDRQQAEVFVGRAVELAQVAEVIARVEAGQPWLVAIEGDPGIGKTALARRCLAGAAACGCCRPGLTRPRPTWTSGWSTSCCGRPEVTPQLVVPVGGTGSAVSSFAVGARLLRWWGSSRLEGRRPSASMTCSGPTASQWRR